MPNVNPSWRSNVGINHVGAYQVSGEPYAVAGLDCTNAIRVTFPYVTRWIHVVNRHHRAMRVGFSEIGISGSHYFTVQGHGSGSCPVLELKVSEIWLYGPGNLAAEADVVAGLTSIPHVRTSGSYGPSWSGSLGVG
jgi:hypothetical protein